jgi:hypothetical protein
MGPKWEKRQKKNCFLVWNNQKTGFYEFFHFKVIWARPNGPKKVPKGLQVGGMYGPMFKLKNKPLIKLLGGMVQNNQKTGFYVFFHFGAVWAPPTGPKKIPKGLQVDKTCGPMSKLENKPLTKLLSPFF